MPLSPPHTSERVPAHTTPRTPPPFSPGVVRREHLHSFPLRSVTCRPFVTRFSTCCRLVDKYHAHVASWRAKFARIENFTRGLGSHSGAWGVATGPIPSRRVESWEAIDWQWESHFAVLYHVSYCMRRAGQAKAATSAAYLTAHAMTMPVLGLS